MGMAVGILALAVACGNAATPLATSTPLATQTPVTTSNPAPLTTTAISPTLAATEARDFGPVVRVDEVAFPVELAVTPDQRIKGLSGRAFLDSGTGMLFVFEFEDRLRFWMRDMEIPLDMIWISANCKVVDISVNVPPPDPGTPLGDLPRYSPSGRAMYVLEINGGEAEWLGLGAGDLVRFVGALAGQYGC